MRPIVAGPRRDPALVENQRCLYRFAFAPRGDCQLWSPSLFPESLRRMFVLPWQPPAVMNNLFSIIHHKIQAYIFILVSCMAPSLLAVNKNIAFSANKNTALGHL
jgi:hypothetical protein